MEILNLKQVAELLQLSQRQIINMCRDDSPNPMPHVRVNGRAIRFRRADVNAWFEKNLLTPIS